jgi:AcrR family transcriptional regulator
VGSDGAATRARILRCARELFSRRGYEKTSLTAVAQDAGLSRTALYRYYDSKDALFRAVIDEMTTSVMGEMFGAGARDAHPLQRVTEVYRASARFNAADPSYGHFLSTLLVDGFRDPRFTPLARAQVDQVRAFFAAAIREARADGRLDAALDDDALADLLLGLHWGLGLFAAFMGDAERLDAVIEIVARDVAPRLLGLDRQ